MRVAPAELFKLFLGEGCVFIGDCAYAQGDQHLVGMQTRIVMAEVMGFKVRDRLDDGGGDEVDFLVDAGQGL